MELSSVIGLVLGLVFILLGMLIGADFDASKLLVFIDYPSIMITGGGTIAGMLISYTIPQCINGLKGMGNIFKPPNNNPASAISEIINLANLARREGILALEEGAQHMEDQFLRKGIMLIVDGTDPELVRSILETELTYIENRHGSVKGFWDKVAAMAPAWGMIGTLIGLVQMLNDLNPDTLGSNMAVALLTTLYGSVIANYIATPIANKLENFNGEEMLIKEVLIEGILSIQAGENPRIIEEKLKSFFSPALREQVNTGTGGGE